MLLTCAFDRLLITKENSKFCFHGSYFELKTILKLFSIIEVLQFLRLYSHHNSK